MLRVDWGNASPSDSSQTRTLVEAIADLADGDRRPLLIYRVPARAGAAKAVLSKTDKKVQDLLSAALKSERFQLASQWFNCMQIDEGVLDVDHPSHSVFSGRHPGRLVLASADGRKVVKFLGTAKDRVSWAGIASILKPAYRKDPTAAVKGIERLLSKFDALDSKRKELQAQLARYAKKQQADKIKSFKKKLAKNEKQRTKLFEQKKKLENLQLRPESKKADE